MRVLVTGGAGYLGRASLRALQAEGHRPIVLVHKRHSGLPDDIEQRPGNVLDAMSLHAAVDDVDAVVHLAAVTGIRTVTQQPVRDYRLNLVGTLNVLEALEIQSERTGQPGRLIFASSCSVYGIPTTRLISEISRPNPGNPYGATKLAAEEAIAVQASTGSLGAISLRLFNLAGAAAGLGDPNQTRLVPRAAAAVLGRVSKLNVYGDGSAVRDYVHVKDAAVAVVHGLRACQPGRHEVFNVGATPASVAEIVTAMSAAAGRAVPVDQLPPHPGEIPEVRADTTRIRDALRWKPAHSSLEEIIRDQWQAALRG